jgi:hypothetical protein
MTFQEWIKALPEAERVKFHRAIMAVADAGYKAGVPADELAKMYVDTYKQADAMLKAREK